MITKNKKIGLEILGFANIYIIWGITFLAISFGLESFPPFILSALRFLAAGLLIIGFLYIKGEKPNSLKNWKINAFAGILVLTGGTGLVAWAEQYVTASEAAIAIATGPFWFIVIDRKDWKYYFSDPFITGGLILGFLGLILFLDGSVNSTISSSTLPSLRWIAFGALFLSSVLWVLGSLYTRNKPANHSTIMNIGQQLTVAGVASLIIGLFSGEWKHFSPYQITLKAWMGLWFLVIFGSLIAYLSYIWLLKVRPAAIVSTHTYINPLVAVLAGWLLVDEKINATQIIGLSIILFGVLLTNLTKYLKPYFRISKRAKVKWRKKYRIWSRISSPYRHITHG